MTNKMPNEIYIQLGENRIGTEIFLRKWSENPFENGTKYIRADYQPADVAGALEDLAYLRYFIKTLGEQKQISLPEVEVMMPRIERVRVALKAQQPDVNKELLEALKKQLPYDEIEQRYSNCYLANERARGYNEAIDDCIKAISRAEQKGRT